MALRCLLFSSNPELAQPIWQVLAALEIEGEYCQNAMDAVEKVTTQSFQIVITDWDDQPEAGFLLKTARDLKASQRPLTLAIVSDDSRLPEALRAGANSVLAKPIRPEQVRDTMSTACQLLRSKQQSASQPPATLAAKPSSETVAFAAAAAAAAVSAPPSLTQAPEKIRAGEFLQSPASVPGSQFDTDSEATSFDDPSDAKADALTELEPMAAAVETSPAEEPKPDEPLTGWASLQARLTKNAPPKVEPAPAKNELLSFQETPAYGASPSPAPAALSASPGQFDKRPVGAGNESPREAQSEAALHAYISGEPIVTEPATQPGSRKHGKVFLGVFAIACLLAVAIPRTRQSLQTLSRNGARAAVRWLNPPPAPLPQAVALHDSFGQSGDEYKLPTPTAIPDATTDPSQIRVVPVIDPTAKADKNAAANGQAQASTAESVPEQNQSPTDQGPPAPVEQKDPNKSNIADSPQNSPVTTPGATPTLSSTPTPAPIPAQTTPSAIQTVTNSEATAPVRTPPPPRIQPISASTPVGIPASLKSHTASSTPESSGAKPPDAAMSSIEPVNLTEVAVRESLAQAVDPEYPPAARAAGQHGTVVLQILVDRDGTVAEAKFLQGSLVFARSAIDAVKQWRFKPYLLNGRAVLVRSTITLAFKPPA